MNFMKGFSDKIHKPFDKKSEPNGDDCEDHSLTVDNGINDLVIEFEDCVDLRDNDIEVNANGLNGSVDDRRGSSDDNHLMANQRMGEEFVSKREAKRSTDWYELQTMETQSKCSSSEKWGESVGIFDTLSGAQTPLIGLRQLQKYFVVKLSSLNSN
ncbi:unnamed protein product [Medioppia subpectinata]|uniref:Uncharacterized protein n=1 Tax=Medioppia subpectinata TaxID=1979941 RepID=A0A7R9KNY5_9ACAR|nr:unnamed protein product [Medioppia subpectinata]CAG2106760.1 unnamed protein product [Medioppia subpectinata]